LEILGERVGKVPFFFNWGKINVAQNAIKFSILSPFWLCKAENA
jgi:hypothetical protein